MGSKFEVKGQSLEKEKYKKIVFTHAHEMCIKLHQSKTKMVTYACILTIQQADGPQRVVRRCGWQDDGQSAHYTH